MAKKKKKKVRVNFLRLFASLLIVALLVFAITLAVKGLYNKLQGNVGESNEPTSKLPNIIKHDEPEEPAFPEPVTIDLRCIGDLMAHQTQLDSAHSSADGSYNFDKWFTEVTPYLGEASDLLLANVETTFKGEGPYTGYPDFNTPDAYADTIVNTLGVDVACFANNHMLDGGMNRLKRGVQYFRDLGAVTTGLRFDGEERWTITEVKGVKIGIVNYCFETPQNGGRRTLQAGILSDEALELINHFGYEDLEGDLIGIKHQMSACREAGADIVVAFMHWGEEYQNSGNSYQRKIGQYLAENGADVVFGSHPHVVQEIDEFVVDDGNGGTKTVPVYYSLGNFISNQRRETLDNKYTENGMIAVVNLTWSFEESRITETKAGFIPTWVDRYKSNKGWEYSLIPLVGDFESCESFATSGHKDYAKSALEYMTGLVGENYLWK